MFGRQNLSHAAIIDGIRRGRTAVLFRSRTQDAMVELTAACSADAASDDASSKQDIQHVGGRCPLVPQSSSSSSAPASAALFVRVSFDYASIVAPVEVRLLLNNAVAYRWANVSRAQSFSVTAPYPTDGSTDRWRAQVQCTKQQTEGGFWLVGWLVGRLVGWLGEEEVWLSGTVLAVYSLWWTFLTHARVSVMPHYDFIVAFASDIAPFKFKYQVHDNTNAFDAPVRAMTNHLFLGGASE